MPKTNESKLKYIRSYNQKNYKQMVLHLHKSYDKDIIDFLNAKDNRAAYLKEMIRSDMHRAE